MVSDVLMVDSEDLSTARCKSAEAIASLLGLALAGVVVGGQTAPVAFADITQRAGIAFVHHNGAAGNKWDPELFGGSVAVRHIHLGSSPVLLLVHRAGWW